jgi:hypothetical protein
VAAVKESYTGRYLKDLLVRRAKSHPAGGGQAKDSSGKKQAAE